MKRFYIRRIKDGKVFLVIMLSFNGYLITDIESREMKIISERKLKKQYLYASALKIKF